jgi:hypothetical protein
MEEEDEEEEEEKKDSLNRRALSPGVAVPERTAKTWQCWEYASCLLPMLVAFESVKNCPS